jgi:molybdate transport system substrate-binding protein
MAATLTVLSAGAIKQGVAGVATMFERANCNRVVAEFTSAPKVRARVLAGEEVDVVIASAGTLDALAQESKIVPATRATVGRTRMAVMMRRDAEAPDLSSVEAFRQALLEADALVYNEGSSGAHAAAVIDKLDLRERMGEKIWVVRNGAEMVSLVTSQPGRVLALAQLTSILGEAGKGVPVAFAGLFPDAMQNVTSYEAAVASSSRNAEPAAAFVRTFAATEARQLLAAAGVD